MRHLAILLLLWALPAAADPTTGAVTGTVVAVKAGKAVKADYLFVYLQPAKRPRYPGRGKTFQIHQKDKQFNPHVLVIPSGSVVEFPNDDDHETHNVFSPNGPPAQFDLGRRNKTDKPVASHAFEDAGEVELYCDIHKDMWAKVKVVDSPYIADAHDGTFTITGIAPGTYKVVAWAPSNTEVSAPEKVTVTAGQTATAKPIHLQLSPPNTTHLRKDGKPYCPDGYADC